MTLLGRLPETERAEMQVAHLRMICQGLLFQIVQQSQDVKNRGFAVVLTSPTQGAGVSRMTSALTDALNRTANHCAISLNCKNFDCDSHDFMDWFDVARKRSFENLWQTEKGGENWPGAQENIASALDKFRRRYRFVLIDSPSLRETQDAIRLAPLVDGIVLVVEADRTQKEQLMYAERALEAAKGKILGHVLNKRTYPIPDWLSRRMEAIGL